MAARIVQLLCLTSPARWHSRGSINLLKFNEATPQMYGIMCLSRRTVMGAFSICAVVTFLLSTTCALSRGSFTLPAVRLDNDGPREGGRFSFMAESATGKMVGRVISTQAIDETGKTYGRLTVIERAPNIGKYVAWNCLCVCGKTLAVRADSLRSGNTKSCGCLKAENGAKWLRRLNTKHGECSQSYRSSEWYSWQSMIIRCEQPKSNSYQNYGGRGIKVCERWRKSFANFLADMGRKPPGMTLDRIDVNGDYEPGNCRWATHSTQTRNRRTYRVPQCSNHCEGKVWKFCPFCGLPLPQTLVELSEK